MWDELLGCLEDFAELYFGDAQPGLSVRISGAVQRTRERLGLSRTPRNESAQAVLVAGYRTAATNESPADAWREGSSWEVEDAVRFALEGKKSSVETA
jgi:hypothetical protein